MQPFKFDSIDEFLEFLPDQEREIVDILRSIVRECMPEAREKLSYNVPYYSLKSRICFIWPSSVPWGKVQPNGVVLGFCKGFLLQDDLNYLEKGNRKQVYTKTFADKSEIYPDLLRSYLFEAIDLDAR
jgi:hypothetical protein